MKKLIFTIISIFCVTSMFAQAPAIFNYQALIRDSNGDPMESQNVSIDVEIMSDSVVFTETHEVTTNLHGMVSLQIGAVNDSTLGGVDFAADTFFIEVSVDGELLGKSQLLSVPYAMHAKTSSSFSGDMNNEKITRVGTPESGSDAATKDYVDRSTGILEGKMRLMNPALTGTVTDIDGNEYKTLIIGEEEWMIENLKTATYNDGEAIPYVEDSTAWTELTTPAYAWHDDDSASYNDVYGKLYNWYAVGTGKLCPEGWHVSTLDEIDALFDLLGGIKQAGYKMKTVNDQLWTEPNDGATNESGFSGIPGGSRWDGFYVASERGTWWIGGAEASPQNGWRFGLRHNKTRAYRNDNRPKWMGMSVRCVKDKPE